MAANFPMSSSLLSSLFKRLSCRNVRAMGSIISCGKNGSVSIAGSQTNISKADTKSMRSNCESGDIIEGIVCTESDIPDEGIKAVELKGNKILVTKSLGNVYAVGAKCSHFGLPLENGSVCNGRIRCPFHGACFSLATGDIEDFPGLDSIPNFDVKIIKGEVKVTARKSQFKSHKRVKALTNRDTENNQTFIVVGGGAAGAKCLESLRQEGFSGRLILLSADSSRPYDRVKLSKSMHLQPEEIALRSEEFYNEADIELKLDSFVQNVDTSQKEISTSSGETYNYDKVFFATGGKPRELTVPGSNLSGVFVLRTPSDANAILENAKEKKVVVIGSSFIGMEAAAYLSQEERCSSVTLLGASAVPFERSLGAQVGGRVQRFFEEQGVTIINDARVTRLEGSDSVEKVIFNEDQELEAQMVVVGIGVVPSTDYFKDSGVNLDSRGFVPVNERMETNVTDVYCGGDVAAFPLFSHASKNVSIGHWQMALMHGHVAAMNMIGKRESIRSVPFFWTMFFGKSLRYAGYGSFDDVIISGSLEEMSFIAYYCSGDTVVGVASMGPQLSVVANYANYIYKGSSLTKEEVLADGDVVMKLCL